MRWLMADATLEVARPADAVWAFVTDVAKLPLWVEGVSEPDLTSAPPLALGSMVRSRYTYRNRSHEMAYTVSGFEPGRRFELYAPAGPFPVRLRLELRPAGSGVSVRKTTEAGSDGVLTAALFLLTGPLARRMMRKQIRRELAALKAALED